MRRLASQGVLSGLNQLLRLRLRNAAILGLILITWGRWQSAAAQSRPATTTTVAVTSGTSSSLVTTTTSGTVIILTATVTAGSTPLTVGQVSFCDAAAKACTDIHRLGLAQLTSAGTAIMKFRPGPGSHQYKAVFAGTNGYESSVSAVANLAVTGPTPTTTTLTDNPGVTGTYDLTATVYGTGSTAPGGKVSFLNTSDSNAVLASATLSASPAAFSFVTLPYVTVNGAYSSGPMTIGDFNGDGIPDAAVIYSGGSGSFIGVLPGSGDGNFASVSQVNTAVNVGFGILSAADFNGDGVLDLAEVDSGSLNILLGKGDGTFTELPASAVIGTNPASIVVADFNGDGIPDLAVADQSSNEVMVLLGKGDGTFTPTATNLQTGSGPYFIATADFDKDGIPDLAVLNNNNGQNTLTIYRGNGAGGFTLVTIGPGTGTAADVLAVGDMNGDGIPDLVAVRSGAPIYNPNSQVTVLTGNGDGTFKAAGQVSYNYSGVPVDRAFVADFNGDGKPDVFINADACCHLQGGSTVFWGDGNGGITISGVAAPPASEASDLNGDGVPDLAWFAIPTIYSPPTTIISLTEWQSAAATASAVTLPPATGTSQVVASDEGNSTYQPSISPPVGLTAGMGTPMVTVTASSNPAPYGMAETLTAHVTGTGLTPTGSVTFYDGAGQLGSQSLTNGAATLVTGAFAVGSHSITVSYAGDSNYTASTSQVLNLVVQEGPPTIGITLSSSSVLNTQSLSVAITVSGASGSQTPQGTVALSGGGYTSAATTLSSTGAATITVPAGSLAVGNDTITATYTPSAASAGSYTSATQSATVTVIKIGSGGATVTVSPSAAAITDQQPVNVSVTVAGGQGGATPTGSVTLASGSYSAQVVLSSGAATFAIPAGTLSAGTDTLTATYTGDGTFAGASGTATVTVSPVVMAVPAPSPVSAGGTATATVTLTAGSTYSGTMNLSCALKTSPANAQSPPTCDLSPATATIATGGNATTTLTAKTTGGTSANAVPLNWLWSPGNRALTLATLLMIGLRLRRRWTWMVALVVMGIAFGITGCGGGHSNPPVTPPTTAGTYVFSVTATDSKNTAITTSANVSVKVQ